MKEAKISSTIVVLNSKNYHVWIRKLKGLADLSMVWEYVDPASRLERPQPFEFPDPTSFVVPNINPTMNKVVEAAAFEMSEDVGDEAAAGVHMRLSVTELAMGLHELYYQRCR